MPHTVPAPCRDGTCTISGWIHSRALKAGLRVSVRRFGVPPVIDTAELTDFGTVENLVTDAGETRLGIGTIVKRTPINTGNAFIGRGVETRSVITGQEAYFLTAFNEYLWTSNNTAWEGVGTVAMSLLLNAIGSKTNPWFAIPFWWHMVMGGWAFGMAFMATDPVTSPFTEKGKWIYGFGIGALVVLVRVVNPAYPECMMLVILFMNVMAPLIDFPIVKANIKRRAARGGSHGGS